MRENAAAKARRLLAESRVAVTKVTGPEIDAIVRGDSARMYLVQHRPGWWTCPSDAVSALCSHVQAVQLVTVVPGTWIASPDLMVGGGVRVPVFSDGRVHQERPAPLSLRCVPQAGFPPEASA
jgi:hypothetical protein